MQFSASQVVQPAKLGWYILTLILMVRVLCVGYAWPETPPAPRQTSLQWWQQFREAHPFHSQLIAVSDPDRKGKRTLLIAEPPPHLRQEDVHRLLARYAKRVEIKKAELMFDGYVRDVVATLEPTDADALDELMTHLHWEMFGSTYGAFMATLPVKAPVMLGPSLNVEVSAAELHQWLLEESNRLVPTTLTASLSLSDVLQQKKRGLFRTATAGLVVWVLDRKSDITQRDDEIRRFVLDGDLIIGAVADRETVCIVARERATPMSRLPPLRTEMVKLLAAIRTPELAQSYERHMWLAGRGKDGFDWAPIYLSPELINTEFGSLLNITDQLLKSWSEHGQIKYHRFNYPVEPPSFPFGATRASASGQEDGFAGFLFNWHTAGALYTTKINGLEFTAVHRTGSLPIIYGSVMSGSVMSRRVRHERTGYEWFSSIGDAHLARVVQYSALFSIFKRYGIKSKFLEGWAPPRLAADALREASLRVLDHIMNSEQTPRYVEEVTELSERLQNAEVAAAQALLTMVVKTPPEERAALIKPLANFLSDLRTTQKKVHEELDRASHQVFRTPEHTQFRGYPSYKLFLSKKGYQELEFARLSKEVNEALEFARMGGAGFQRIELSPRLADERDVRQKLIAASGQEEQRWVKTASIVLSQDIKDKRVIGGHHISAKMTEFRADITVPPGQASVRSTPEGATTNEPAGAAEADVEAAPIEEFKKPRPPRRSMSQALSVGRDLNSESHHLDYAIATATPISLRRPGTATELESVNVLSSIRRPAIHVTREADRFVIRSSESTDVLEVRSSSGLSQVLVEHLRAGALGGGEVHVLVSGMPPPQFQEVMKVDRQRVRDTDGERPQPAVVAEKGAWSARTAERLTTPLDWTTARINNAAITTRTISKGPLRGTVEMSIPIEVKPVTAGRPWVVRLVPSFKETVTDALKRETVQKVTAALRDMKDSQEAFALSGGALKRRLGSAGLDVTHIEVHTEDLDLYMAGPAPLGGSAWARDHSVG